MNVGRVVQVIGPTVDVAFEPDKLPRILNAIRIEDAEKGINVTVGGRPARRRQPGPLHRHELDRRPGARHEGRGHRRPDHRAGGRAVPGPALQPARRDHRRQAAGRDREALPDPPPVAVVRGAGDHARAVRDRHQGRRPARALLQGRQDRPVRRRRRGQDRADPGADPQHRHRARRLLGVRRRGRAHPRGQRPLPRDEPSRASSPRP